MNRITKLIEESNPSITEDVFFSTASARGTTGHVFRSWYKLMLSEVLAQDVAVQPGGYQRQVQIASHFKNLDMYSEGIEILMHVKDNIEKYNSHFTAWIENEISLYDKDRRDMLREIFSPVIHHDVFPKGTKPLVEVINEHPSGTEVVFCKHGEQDKGEFITALIGSLQLLEHAKEMEEGCVFDRPDHTGSHVQTEAPRRAAAVVVQEDLELVVASYLESGKYFKVVKS